MSRSYDNAYSRIVALLKLVLPLAALVLLSTLFLVSKKISPEDALPYADVDVDELTREQRVTAPRYSTLTDNGSTLTFTARTARPEIGTPGRTLGEEVKAVMQGKDGKTTDVIADHGRMEQTEDRLYLDGNVVVTTSDGMQLRSQKIDVTLGTGEAVSPGHVEGDAPFGHLTGGSMHLYGPQDAQMLDFAGGVTLVYQPKRDDTGGTPEGAASQPPAPVSDQQGDSGQ
ncbi:LPS export ABC transporter periplasmic protein LptC [Frigidibacter sp. MR17.14]|uniref:LPS export ABC transporter periplasmic protein LptC n=1 Tax=Frigidibacter sp. MR17.14 TaxID=3126509 RepID=UPI003012D4B6